LLLSSEISGGIRNEDRDGANVAVAIVVVVVVVVRVAIASCLSDSPEGGSRRAFKCTSVPSSPPALIRGIYTRITPPAP